MNLQQKIIKPKIGLLELAKSLGNISALCKTMGYSRDSYYEFKSYMRREEKKRFRYDSQETDNS